MSAGVERVSFHGWPHIKFIRKKAMEFASRNGADIAIVEAAALVHDVNYLVAKGSHPREGQELRAKLLASAGFDDAAVRAIEAIVLQAHVGDRGEQVSAEAAALSDADTLYKILPITPVVLSESFRRETGLSLTEQADKIIFEQMPLLHRGWLFYDSQAEREYAQWAKTNLELWSHVRDAIVDPMIRDLLGELGVN